MARTMAGRPLMSKQTLCRSAECIRVPLPPARMMLMMGYNGCKPFEVGFADADQYTSHHVGSGNMA